jgi:hypothetical protein
MLSINRLLWVGLLGFGIGAATTAQAGFQLFDAWWIVEGFGNECSNMDPSPGPYCPSNTATATGPSRVYQAYRVPQGLLCNPDQPRCPLVSTPVDGTPLFSPKFAPLGGSPEQALYCTRYTVFGSGYKGGASGRPVKGATVKDENGRPIAPLYRNPLNFTPGGQRNDYSCAGYSTDGFGGPGLVQLGQPIAGRWSAITTGTQRGGFSFPPASTVAPAGMVKGVRVTGTAGSFGPAYPYIYSYTYATLRNDAGLFGPGKGPGTFDIPYNQGGPVVARINVTAGKNKFGGTMRMLGALTGKVCFYHYGGCSLGSQVNWRYDAVGATAMTAGGVVTKGYIASSTAYYYLTAAMQVSTLDISGARFPWTTGAVTVTAVGRGPHKTIHYAHGYDNRKTTTPNGIGTIQLVTPVLTQWLQVGYNSETGGIGILKIKFLPEPHTWVMLVAGVSLLAVGCRRGR